VALPAGVGAVPEGGHVAIAVPGVQKAAGEVWTAVVTVDGANVAYGGRVMPERFPIEVWPTSSDCPLPGANEGNANFLKQVGIDSVFYDGSNFQGKCGKDFPTVVEALPQSNWFHVFVGKDDLATIPSPARGQAVDAVLIGDEVDGKIDADHLLGKLADSLAAMKTAPEVPVYQGSKTNHNVGAFSGITDVQGSDAYSAACAPTMAKVTQTLPLQYPYFYLRNARDNHAPLPMWGYSQLYSSAWGYQANSNELAAQIVMTALSGSKGLMMFQSKADEFSKHDYPTWQAAIMNIRGVSEILRTGDVGGVKFATSSKLNLEIQMETFLTPEKLLVIVLNTNAEGYSNLLCHTGISKHWTFKDHKVSTTTLDLTSAPGVASVGNWQEIVNGVAGPVSDVGISGATGTVTLTDIHLKEKSPIARFFVADVAGKGMDFSSSVVV